MINQEEKLNSRDNDDNDKRICSFCKKEIIGRAIRTGNGNIYHRQCHKCSKCGCNLSGKKYGINPKTKLKMCETCSNAYNTLQINNHRSKPRNSISNNNSSINKRQRKAKKMKNKLRKSGSQLLIAQMNNFKRDTSPKPPKKAQRNKSINNIATKRGNDSNLTCNDCKTSLKGKKWDNYPSTNGIKKLCKNCITKRDEQMFKSLQGKLQF